MRDELRIRNRTIGEDHPLFITAEVGVTCNYDMSISRELLDVVAESGADAAKFIFWFPDEIMSDHDVTYTYSTVRGTVSENMYEMLNKLRFSLDQWRELKEYADRKGVILFSTVNSRSGIEWAEEIGLEAYKLSSWDFNHHPLWRAIARLGKPMIIDTGPVFPLDVAKVMALMQEEGNDQGLLVHCIHTDNADEVNMRAIPYMRRAFNTLTGYSSRDCNCETDIMAVTLGAVYMEKRLTLDRSLPGHHHVLSMEPKEFGRYVRMIRDVQRSLGVEDLRPSRADLDERKKWFRHLAATCDIPTGTVLTAEMLEGKRPQAGMSPEYLAWFLGRKTKKELKTNEAISLDHICQESQ